MFPGVPRLDVYGHEVGMEGFTTALLLEMQGEDDDVIIDGIDSVEACGSRHSRPPTLHELVKYISDRSDY